jgi:hypothetical protein
MFDHYPFGQTETERANALRSWGRRAQQRPPIISRYGFDFCSACSLMIAYCRCAERSADSPSNDNRAESDLSRRIREAKR